VTHFAERLKAPSNSLDADGTTCGQRCRFWVIRVDLAVGRLLPINPDEQTFAVSDGMSQMGQQRKSVAADSLGTPGGTPESWCRRPLACARTLRRDAGLS